jgi:lysophospholipase L1-like esterase
MTTYNTGNPLGSKDVKDLYDNAENLDEAVNSDNPTFLDRLGRTRQTYQGLESQYPNAQAQAEIAEQFANASASSAEAAELSAEAAELSAAEAENQANLATTNGADQVLLAAAQASIANTARTNAEAARDAAFVNANVFDSIAAGLAAVANGVQFQVVSADGLTIDRYRRDSASVAVLVATYPSNTAVLRNTIRLNGAIATTKNLFNKFDSGVADNFFVNHSTGALQANTAYTASGFIPVVAGSQYFINFKSFIAWYTAGGAFISGSSNTDTNQIQTAPSGAGLLRISLQKTAGQNLDYAIVSLNSEGISGYEPFGGVFVYDKQRVPASFIKPLNTSFMEQGKNLFDKDAVTPNFTQTTAELVPNASFDLSDYIPVAEGVTYQYASQAGGARFRACFNVFGVNVAAQASSVETSSYTVPVGSGVRFMRLSIAKARVAGFQVEEGSAPSSFEPFGFNFNSLVLPQSNSLIKSNWKFAKCSSYGDSITAQSLWQPKVATRLGVVHTAYGVSGRQVSGSSGMCQDAAVNTLPTDTKLLLVLGGTNDWAQSRALGAVNSTNTEEFYGALNQMAQKLTTRLPTARIIFLTTPYGELPERVTSGTWTTAHTNTAGLTTKAYAEAVRVAARRWGFPVVDLDECGWNEINLTTYMQADGGSIHPNDLGATRMAEVVTGRLLDLEPLS